MRDTTLRGPWIRRFLLEHLIAERNLARNTQISYRDTLIVLLPFLGKSLNTPIDRLSVEQMSPKLIRRFLEHLEKERRCGGATRNLRLAAIHSLAKFIGGHSPEYLPWSSSVRAVPFRKVAHPTMAYLEKAEMDAVLNAPDRRTPQGQRDFAMLLFLYNTGARADQGWRFVWCSGQLRSVDRQRIQNSSVPPMASNRPRPAVFGTGSQPRRACLSQSSRAAHDALRHLRAGVADRRSGREENALVEEQAHQPAFD